MKTHFEPTDEFCVREVIDEYTVFECDKGHMWRETLENHLRDLPLPINFPIPNGDGICPFCLSERLRDIGRVKTKAIKGE